MTVTPASSAHALGLCRQLLVVILIHVPTVSLGLAMGWVSLVSGEHGEGGPAGGREAGARVVVAAATTFLASLVGVPISAYALKFGRKFAIIATSVCFLVCWALKLAGGGWWVVAARVAAGLGGAGAYSIPPLVAREMCESSIRGAATAALVVAHNLGLLFMYIAADLGFQHRSVVWWCLGLSALHCGAYLLMPESPAFLAANNRDKEAARSLAWLRGLQPGHPALAAELSALAPPEPAPAHVLALLPDLVREPARRRAFVICFVAIVGQEACGVYTLMQFAERTFVLARDSGEHGAGAGLPLSPARMAVVLGAVQLLTSAVALYLVERVGRRRLLLWSGVLTAGCLALAAGAAWAGASAAWTGGGPWAALALAGAVAADSGGLQPAPYALLADMFSYQYRSTALMVSSAAACAANALEVAVFPALAAAAGLAAALALAAALTAGYTLYVFGAVPETRGRSLDCIYADLARPGDGKDLELSTRV